MEETIVRYGLPAVFLGALIEGDLTLILVGVVAHLGLLQPVPLFGAAVAGLLVADIGWFALGWRAAQLLSRPRFAAAQAKIDALTQRLGAWQLLLARVLYGTRTVSMIYWGARHLSISRFLGIDLIGCIVWAATLGSLGYALSGSAAAITGEVKRVEIWLLVFAAVAAIVVFALHRVTNSKSVA